jgi:gliding motility-associated-like protein
MKNLFPFQVFSLTIVFLIASSILSGQVGGHFCHFDSLRGGLDEKEMQIENLWKDFAAESGQLMPYVLPVVVHVIHDNGPENISDAMALQGIQHLNEAFANMGYYDQGTGVNTQIQFCLAKRDPDGNATTGINHVQSPLTELSYNTQDIDLKNVIRWDPLRYINIWLVREICSNNGCAVAGYAYFPSAHGSLHDGIVMEAKWFGSSNGNSGVQIHEMGHYLGLYHTFEGGCANNDCLSDGDRVCDTPPDQSTAPVPCGGAANSCTTDTQSGFATDQPDMYWNYMDYGDWDCYSAFTQGQTGRMYFFIENVRHSLLDSDACLDPCTIPITAGFTSSDNLADIGTTVNFTNTSANASGYQWLIDGVPFGSGANAAYTFNALGTYVITLEVTNADPNCFDSVNDTIEVVCPVIASFTPTNLFPLPGEIVSFANNSAGGTNFNWSVNGVSQAATMGFSYVFPTEGAYTICLDVDNGLCEQQYCQLVFAYNQGDGCESGFVKKIGNEGVDERAWFLLPAGNGDFLIGGQAGGSSQLTRVDATGNILWQRTFDFTNGDDFIRYMMLDSEGHLVMVGRDQYDAPTINFLARFDLQTQTPIWVGTFPLATMHARFEGMLEKPGNGNYLLHGMVLNPSYNAYIQEVDKNTGAALWQREFDLGGNTDNFHRHLLAGNDLYFASVLRFPGGLDKLRASIVKTDLNGNIAYAKAYFQTENQQARTYAEDILKEGDTLVTLSRGVFNGSDLTASGAILMKTDLGGNIYWVRNYAIPGGSFIFSRHLLALPDGYILSGEYRNGLDDDVFYIRVDKNGNVIWAKTLGTPGNDFCYRSAISNNALFFAASTEGYDGPGLGDILFGSIPLDPSPQNDSCDLVSDMDVYTVIIQNNLSYAVSLTENNPSYSWMTKNVPAEDSETLIEDIPSCACAGSIPCVSSFVRTLGTGATELATRIIPEPGGGFILGGSKADSTLIALLDSDGHPVWERTIKITSLTGERITDLLIDSDQNLVAIGVAGVGNIANFIFKYDYQNDNLLWIRQPNPSSFNAGQLLSIQEAAAGGNYLVAGQTSPNSPPGSGCDGVLMEVDRNSGALVWVRNYHLGSCETFSKIVVHANSVYATGRYNYAGGGLDKMRPGITQTDLSGNELWSRLYLRNITGNFIARLYSAGLVADNGLVVPGHGDMDGTDAINVSLQLFKTDYTGNLLWAREFDITGGDTERFTRLINLPDGYLGIGTFNLPGSGSQVFLIKTDKNGVVQWSKHYGGAGADAGADILFQGGYLYLVGTYANLGADVLLARLTLDGDTADACDAIEDLAITQSAIANPYAGSHPLTVYNTNWPFLNPAASFQFSDLPENVLCETACLDSCLVAPDAFFQIINAQCIGDSLLVTVEVCNEGPGILYAGTPVNFYDGDPAAGGVLLGSSSLPEDLAELSCATWTLPLAAPANTTLYAWVNDLTAPGFDTLECDLADNIATFSVPYAPPLLDLGPDTVMCGFGVVALQANAGFASFLWPDGSTAATYTALEPGVHWVVATDSCGGVQSDTVNITVYSSAISYDTLEFCLGDTVLVFGQPATEAGEYTGLLTGFKGCDSVAVLTLVESTDTIVTVSASAICAGETYDFYGQSLDAGGVYEWADTSSSCVKLETLTLTVLDTFATFQDIATCANEPADIFGVPTSVPGTYAQAFAAANGCDSVHTITLTVTDTVATSESLTICSGETVIIFGTPVSTAGTYTQTFAGQNGCDSTHSVALTVLTAMQVTLNAQGPCPGAADGSAAAQVSGGLPPYQYDWGSGPGSSASAGNLSPGNYTLLVTDANGCNASAGFSIQSAPPPSLTTEGQDVTCFGDTDGSLVITAADPGLSYSLDGQVFSGQAQWENLSPGDYTLYVQDAGGCISEIPFTIGQPAPINVLLPPGVSLQWGESEQLAPVISPAGGVYVYAWSPPDGLSCTDCEAPIAQPDFSGTYVLVVTDTLGCTARATVLVEVERNQDVFIPSMFSPNADGINDAFTIFSGPQVVSIRTMKVFDRWGEKVFEGADLRPNDLSQGWDGTFRGKPMNPGVFGYLAELEFANGIVLTYNGSLTLVR